MKVILCWLCLLASILAYAQGYSLRFYGNGIEDIDRIKIRIDDPDDSSDPGIPLDVGASDFTIEFWMKANGTDNDSDPVSCGANNNWINGNIIIDRDRYNQGRNYGVSVAGGFIVFGTMGNFGDAYTICSDTDVLDDQWHHIAVQRRRSDGWMWIYVDGILETEANGPNGDISYPDDGVPGNFCGGPCTNSDPFIVIAAEKHDAGPDYPSYSGYLDEIRFSNSLRYSSDFTPPSAPYIVDGNTVGLYRLETGSGDIAFDDSDSGSPDGQINVGGSPPGPIWTSDTPFTILALDEEDPGDKEKRSKFLPCKIAPNPASHVILLEYCEDIVGLELVSPDGVSAGKYSSTNMLDVTGLVPGLYIIRLYLTSDVLAFPIIIHSSD